ncbi:GDSL esterase/lipase EXL3-like [Punica granatum]|uniref:GDSL esterase/lipase EXL3-like n=1 Tax=Punica granatum TaxID=22663 RepID=A0A6P8DWW3_PUNGR|nr:GDSL esterase/lipase EXL3-like [Punica granatum]
MLKAIPHIPSLSSSSSSTMVAPYLSRPSHSTSSPAAASIFLLSAFVLCISVATAAVRLPANVTVPAVFVFGDSIVDPGNNNELQTIAKCNFPPYGRDFPGGKPTGRFSNGRVPSDMLAELVGVKELLPAYLDPNLQIQDLLTGVSFASGAAGYDPQTSETARALSLSDQLDLYKESIAKIRAKVGEDRAALIVSRSFNVVFLGSNDITNTFFGPLSAQDDISSYTDLMVKSATSFIQELYGLGARRIGITGIPPIGCVPAQRTLRGGIERNCFDDGNDAAILFNSKLSSQIDSLSSQLSNSKIVYIDIYYSFLPLIQNPTKYGFEVSTKGCCGTGNIEVSFLCNKLDDLMTCINDEKYVFWDSFHPTEKAYKVVLDQIFKDQLSKFF